MTYIPLHQRLTDAEKDALLFGKKNVKALNGEIQNVRKKKRNEESELQTKITKWLISKYPGIIFFSDFAAGMYIPSPHIRKVRSEQACEGKYLDLTILRPSSGFHGLVLEIKAENDDLFLVDGKTLNSNHVREQYKMILRLRNEGYAADFAVGEEDIKKTIESYINGFYTKKEILYSRKDNLY